jgi:hypothetical protein
MIHELPGLHGATPFPDGFFLVRVAYAQYRTQAEKAYMMLNLSVLEPANWRDVKSHPGCTARKRRCGN